MCVVQQLRLRRWYLIIGRADHFICIGTIAAEQVRVVDLMLGAKAEMRNDGVSVHKERLNSLEIELLVLVQFHLRLRSLTGNVIDKKFSSSPSPNGE